MTSETEEANDALNQEPIRDFIKYAKDYGVDISIIYNRDNPDTFEKLFGIRPCENCVSRVLVQEEIGKSIELKENPHQMWKRIQALPPVQPKQKWISVHDKLPEKGQQVLVSCDSGYVSSDYFDGNCFESFVDSEEEVVAWIPMPEPFKEI